MRDVLMGHWIETGLRLRHDVGSRKKLPYQW
jgi:hypothetical protein